MRRLFAMSLVLLSFLPVLGVSAQGSPGVHAQLGQAYSSVLGAEQSGGNVTSLVATLNTAISLVQQADSVNRTDPARAQALYAQASSLATQVIQISPSVAAAGKASVQAAQLALVAETAILGGLAVLAYLFTPRLYWTLWLRAHKNWRETKA